jgi:hypothetical protein
MPARNASELAAELAHRGYALYHELGADEVVSLSSSLGEIVLETQVRLNPARGTYLTSPEAIPPHNDHPAVDHISWHCQAQDPRGGAMELVDMNELAPRLEPSWLNATMPCPCVKHLQPRTQHPVRDAKGWYYSDWLARSAGLHGLVDVVARAPRIRIDLRPGDALFVDNRRMLQARDAISAGSPRHLVRR